MAKDKKSFIAYADWKDTFDELPDKEAGKLIKHIFAYVNDENPETDSLIIKAVFANIKNTLKRDLNKWESQLEQRREAGRKSAEVRKANAQRSDTKSNARSVSSTDSVSVNDSVSDNENDSVIISDYFSNEENSEYWKDLIGFCKRIYEGFCKFNRHDKELHKIRLGDFVTPIRELREDYTEEQIIKALNWVYESDRGKFWRDKIIDTETLKKHFRNIKSQIVNEEVI